MDKVINRLSKGFRKNLIMYGGFSDLTKEEILEAVFLCITEKRYSNSTANLFLHAFSNIYNVKVIIMHDSSKYGHIIIGEEFEQDIKLYKYHEHYDLLKFTEVSSGSLTQPLVVKDEEEHVKKGYQFFLFFRYILVKVQNSVGWKYRFCSTVKLCDSCFV